MLNENSGKCETFFFSEIFSEMFSKYITKGSKLVAHFKTFDTSKSLTDNIQRLEFFTS